MPGKHKKGKKKTGFYLDKRERDLMKELAARMGVDKTEFLRRLLKMQAIKEGILHEEK